MAAKKKSRQQGPAQPSRSQETREGPPAPDQPEAAAAASTRRDDAAVESEFPVVGIGASAGGLEACKTLFENMSASADIAFVVVQHLDPTQKSLTAELLGRHTQMPVVEISDRMRVEANHIYVIPPNASLALRDGVLRLSAPTERRGARVPIDTFLRSLADDRQGKSIAIILSGTGSDGTLGLKAVKTAGGMTMVQDPRTAEFEGMPRSAIDAGLADFILPPEKMPEALLNYVKHPYVKGPCQVPAGEKSADDKEEELQSVLSLLRERTQYDFRGYRWGTLRRRTYRRMGLKHVERLSDYLRLLQECPSEVKALAKDLLISVTDFFREPEAWNVLEREVIAPLVWEKGPKSPIRVWVPGCATGEEAYSVAMLLLEQAQKVQSTCEIQVFASDIDEEALEFARAGVYPPSIAADVSPERLRRFFIAMEGDHNFEVGKSLRDVVVFARQNILKDPPFSRVDLISCRNLLIYLEPEVQRKVLSLFHFGLGERGCLFLGNSETIGRQEDLFEPISKKWRIYRRIRSTRHGSLAFPVIPGEAGRRESGPAPPPAVPRENRLAELARRLLLDRYAPAAVLITARFEVLYFYGSTHDYLAQPAGLPTQDLLALAHLGLRPKLRSAVHQAGRDGRPVMTPRIRVKRGDRFYPIRLSVYPVKDRQEREDLFLVAFEEEPLPSDASPHAPEERSVSGDQEAIIHDLEEELKATREELQATIEQLQTSHEEFKTAHEEVMSMNEELQSSNEELETSKEELQSLNEELNTVNSQLQNKVEELETVNNDMHNLLASSDIATIHLDRQFRIKWFTQATKGMLSLLPSDVGRPVSDFAQKFTDNHLLRDAEAVLRDLNSSEREVQTHEGRWYIRRVLPYRTEDNRTEGVVVTFLDITQQKHAEEELRCLNNTLEQRVDERTRLLKLMHRIASAANEANTVEEALRVILRSVCLHSGWCFGYAMLRAPDNLDELAPVDFCYGKTSEGNLDFQPLTRKRRIRRSRGLFGRVFATGRPEWRTGLSRQAEDDPDEVGEKLDVKTIAALPVPVMAEVVGVLEFLSDKTLEPDEEVLEAMTGIGTQLGRVIERKQLEQEIANLTENERRRIGHELHDSIAQQLTGTAMMAESLRQQLAQQASPVADVMAELVKEIRECQQQVRQLARGLVPVEVDAHGLMDALERLASGCEKTSGISCRFACHKPVLVRDNSTATHLYHIAQEALQNALKHGEPRHIEIRLGEEQGHTTLTVQDDGRGIKDDAGDGAVGIGHRIMHYRARLIGGRFDVQSKPGKGTTVRCALRAV